MSKRAQLPPPANNNLPKIAVHEREPRQDLVAHLPVAMSAAARQGASPRDQGTYSFISLESRYLDRLACFESLNVRDTLRCAYIDSVIDIVNLVSDDEDSDNDFASLSPSPAAASPSPAPPGQPNELLARQPAPYRPPNPPDAGNLADAEAWEDFVDEDGMNGFDGYDDMDIRDPELERIMMENYNREARDRPPVVVPYRNGEPSGHNQENIRPVPQPEPRAECVDQVMNVFPGICRDHVSNLYDSVSKSSDVLIAHILDKMDKGDAYPNAKKEKEKSLKRKRPLDEDEEAARKYGAVDRIMPYHQKTIT